MIVTEQEAKKRWCPFARVPDVLAATNRLAVEKMGEDGKPRILRKAAMCIASECMAWRWEESVFPDEKVSHGYCGLAGSVQP